MIITIDGPTASGKSSLAQIIANKLKIYYLNSGFLYRGIAYVLLKYYKYDEEKLKNPNIEDLKEILDHSKFVYRFDGLGSHILFNLIDITQFLKTLESDKYSSIVSANKNVRSCLLAYQRIFGQKNSLIIDGRDCGSVVFPNATVKIFLTASIEVRAKRWQQDMLRRHKVLSLDESIKIISARDERDKTREISPLIIPSDAHIIDNSDLDQTQTAEVILNIINKVK